jgi:hypothetical protein
MEIETNLELQLDSAHKNNFGDASYFAVLGQLLVTNANNLENKPTYNRPYVDEIRRKLIAILKKIPFHDICEWLSPRSDPKYSILGEYICSSIDKPSAAIYLQLADSGFGLDGLGNMAVKLISGESEFLANEQLIFSQYFTADTPIASIHSYNIKEKIIERPEFSYEFIMNYLQPKYPKVFTGIQWNKLAVAKGAIDTIHKYDLKLTNYEIRMINSKFCTIQNINLLKSLTPYKPANTNPNSTYEVFKDINMSDFITVNKITDADHSRINYIKYLGCFKLISSSQYGWKNDSLPDNIYNYHPDLVRQFLDYILINGARLAMCKISLAEKLDYIKQKLQTKEYNTESIAKFITGICYTKTVYYETSNSGNIDKIKEEEANKKYSLTEIEIALSSIGIPVPWNELLALYNTNINAEIKWPQIRDIFNIDKCIRNISIYIRFLRNDCRLASDWTPSIQLEYWQILTAGDKRFTPQDRDALIRLLPVEILRDIPVEKIWSYRLYRHDSFGQIINCPETESKKLKQEFTDILRSEIERLAPKLAAKKAKNENEYEYEIKALGFVITHYYSSGIEILENFNIPGIAEVVFEAGNEYRNLSVITLLGLLSMTSNTDIIRAFQIEIERKSKSDDEAKKRNEFAALFSDTANESPSNTNNSGCGGNNDTTISKSVARLANAVLGRPVKYWSEDNYKFACEKGYISAEILREFKRTQPIPHPDWNWRTLTILLGSDQTILAYPELGWQTPVYFRRDSDWVTRTITWEYLENHTQLFSSDSEIWTKFSTKLPIEFIMARPNYRFQWHSIISRPDLQITHENWPIIKSKIRTKDLALHPNRYSIELIAANLDMGWDFKKIFQSRVIPLKYLPKFLSPNILNASMLDSGYSYKTPQMVKSAIKVLKQKLIISAVCDEMDNLKMCCRIMNHMVGSRPHIEKIMLGFATKGLIY